ncbi:MAG TPA: hypothetical protein DCE78_04670 [Bacteroidetes bacterium]|nr:hypothetical protein [Bacteroidota bacterium]
MKNIIKISILTLFFGAIGLSQAQSQQYDDAKMKQDLRISEGILSDIIHQNDQVHRIYRSGSELSSVYIPGFGVIFETSPSVMMLDLARASTVNIVGADDENDQVRVVVRGTSESEGNQNQSSLDNMKANIQTYFMNYADLISQVKPDENITVMVRPNDSFVYFNSPPPPPTPSVPSTSATSPTPTRVSGQYSTSVASTRSAGTMAPTRPLGFMMSVKRSDISDFKSQRINENEFKNRVKVTDINRESNTEFKIFEKILETGLNDIGNETFSLSKNLTTVYDDNLGLIVLGSLRSSSTNFYFQGLGDLERFEVSVPSINLDSIDTDIVIKSDVFTFNRGDLDSMKVEMRRANEELRRAQVEISRAAADIRRELNGTIRISTNERTESRTKEQVLEDLTSFENALKNLVLDYGRTITSVKSDQSIMLNLNVRRSHDGVPTRLVITVPKSTLDAFDKRSISKDAAMTQIKVNRIN